MNAPRTPSPPDWERLVALFEQAADLPPRERRAFVAASSAEDAALRAELESLLDHAPHASSFFDRLSGAAFDAAAAAAKARGLRGAGSEPGEDAMLAEGRQGQWFAGRYRIESLLGRGGMGVVYRAFDSRLRRTIALKCLPPQSADQQASRRFLIEARAAAALDHPNVCTVHEVAENEDGQLYLAMAWYDGETLKQKLAGGPLPIEQSIDYATQIACGLAAAHDRGIIHRDVKPSNVMVTNGLVKLLDFGVARLPDTGDTRPGHTPGTTAYMSPEQARGETLDQRTDLWSLGVVLYEMLTGVRPFRGDGDAAVLHALLNETAVPAPELRPDLPDDLATILDRLLQRDKDARLADTHEVARALEALTGPGTAGISRSDEEEGPSTQPVSSQASAPRLRIGRFALGVAAIAVAVVAAASLTRGRSAAVALDPDAILVAPFHVAADPSLDYLREGMVDLLAASLNGEIGSRAVDPRSVLAAWRRTVRDEHGTLPPERATRIARALGAGQLLMGGIVGTPARLTLNAELYDVAGTTLRTRVTVDGPPDSIPAMVDRLVGQVLAREAGVPRHQLEALTSTSLPALRGYLEGRRSYRLGRFGDAARQLEEALRHDSTFALAAIQLWLTAGWGQLTAEPGTHQRALRLAWSARDRLSPPDRLFLDALTGPRYPQPTPRHELLAARMQALDASPDRPEALALMAAFHVAGTVRGEEGALTRSSEYFRRALQLDSAYAAPVYNLAREAAAAGDAATVHRLVLRYLQADSTSETAHVLEWLAAATSGDELAILAVRARMPAMHPTALGWIENAAVRLGLDVDGGEAALAALRVTARSELEWRNYLGRHWDHLGNRGRLREMWSSRDSVARLAEEYGPIEALGVTAEARARGQKAVSRIAGLFWGGDTTGIGQATDLVEDEYRRSIAPDANPFARMVVAESACFAGIGRIHTGHTAAARAAVAVLRGFLDRPWELPNRSAHAACAATLDALIAVSEGRSDARVLANRADSVLRAEPPLRLVANRMQLMLARAFEELDDPETALRVIRRHGPNNAPFFLATFLREEGRLAARVGDRDGAIRAYRHYLALRTDPDFALVPEVEHIREELAALSARQPR